LYDSDSHLVECQLPNNVVWKASYDSMGRKCLEELVADGESSERWEYVYQNGYLVEKVDPMKRVHTYLYDSHGRVIQENIDGWQQNFTYDPCGLLSSAEQISRSKEHSLIERSYDESGRLISESISLNSKLLQQAHQIWGPSNRTLRTNGHQRDFLYQNNQLIQVSAQKVDLSYTYALNGALKNKTTPLSKTTIYYNPASLPEKIYTYLRQSTNVQSLEWDGSGKLSSILTNGIQKEFSYNSGGYLESAGEEEYEFDFGQQGTGIRTAAPKWHVPENGLDPFERIVEEVVDQISILTEYDSMGQVVSRNNQKFEWDPWGRLLKVSDGSTSWEASYDAFGRRLQTRHTSSGSTLITTSLYDPEEEFQEIGIQYDDQIFWKLYGPNTCDAVVNQKGASVFLNHNILGHLTEVVSDRGILSTKQLSSAYGPQTMIPFKEPDLLKIAESLTWQSKSQDPTGLIWMGARYYDPQGGRFISPDPVRHPLCLDLYVYANGDPINYIDPDGRCFSPAYQTTKTTVVNTFNNPRFQGSMQAFGGIVEAKIGVALCATGPLGMVAGGMMVAHGFDHFQNGCHQAVYGQSRNTVSSQLLQKAGVSTSTADLIDNGVGMFATMGGSAATKAISNAGKFSKGIQSGNVTKEGVALASQNFSKSKIQKAEGMINSYLGEGTRLIKNEAQDLVFISKDGLRKVRFDFVSPKPHNNPHMHVEKLNGRKWWDSGQIYPIDVPHN